jgi:mRNA interferase RelE/StbE
VSTPSPPPVPPAGFGLELTRQAVRDLRRLDRPVRERVFAALERLVAAVPTGDVRALTGSPGEFRLRVGDWRVRCELDIEAELLIVLRVLPRGRAYRD